MTFFRKTTLPSGLRVITEEIPHVRSASIGVWVGAGSCLEQPAEMGISHLIEHMLFKGTEGRTARQIAQAIDGRGGSLNAFTAKEHTCYYARVLDEHLPVAIDVLGDMLQHSLLDPEELEKEKGVVIEEIKMYEDVPDDLVHDLFAASLWKGQSLGRPIVGTAQTVRAHSRDAIRSYMKHHYAAENVVVAAAGHLEHDRVVEEVAGIFSALPHTGATALPPEPPQTGGGRAIIRVKETEQAHLVVGMRALPQEHPEIYALNLLNTILGGGASSRLFQEIRERRGMAYSVFSYHSTFRNAGDFAVYAGVSPDAVEPVLELVLQMLHEAGEAGVTAEELAEAQEQLKGQIMLGLESTSSRMSRLGRGELSVGRVLSHDEIIGRIEAVSLEQVNDLARRLLIQEPKVLSLVGPRFADLHLGQFGFSEVYDG